MKLVAFAIVVFAAAPASAQSKRYPPEPVDKDELEAGKSKLWDAATNPKQAPYAETIKLAQERMAARTRDAAKDAVKLLDEAVAMMPDEPDAYRVRGDAQMSQQNFVACASDFQAAWVRSRRDLEPIEATDLRRKLGLCQARAGKLAEAERTLAEAAATGANDGEIWMRLGEVRIAMGKLEEAIAALESAAEAPDLGSANALVRWLLAGAFDRARKPSEAAAAASHALQIDRHLGALKSPSLPFLGAGEDDYLLGLANELYIPAPRPEIALVHFRKFLVDAPASPWRRRAQDHVRELETAKLPESIERAGGAPLDEIAARNLVRKAMPAMRACAAKLPLAVFEIAITKVGPRTRSQPTPRFHLRYQPPPAGVRIQQHRESLGGPRAAIDGAIRCMEPIANRIALPAVKGRDAYVVVTFRVVGA